MATVKTKKKRTRRSREDSLPATSDWRTTDEQELLKRQVRAREENPKVTNLTSEHPVFSTFRVDSPSGLSYFVEIRSVAQREFHCTCTGSHWKIEVAGRLRETGVPFAWISERLELGNLDPRRARIHLHRKGRLLQRWARPHCSPARSTLIQKFRR